MQTRVHLGQDSDATVSGASMEESKTVLWLLPCHVLKSPPKGTERGYWTFAYLGGQVQPFTSARHILSFETAASPCSSVAPDDTKSGSWTFA